MPEVRPSWSTAKKKNNTGVQGGAAPFMHHFWYCFYGGATGGELHRFWYCFYVGATGHVTQ